MRIEISPYDPAWPELFATAAAAMRAALGDAACRIDHIGSTAVPGLSAKPVIDIQISVPSFEPVGAFRDPLERLGYVFHPKSTERTKRYFRDSPRTRRTNVHVRVAGSFGEQLALLFRDYLRADGATAEEYAQLKRRLAHELADDRAAYTEAKAPFIWNVVRRADTWAQSTGWQPAPSDA